jgi:hypothetical protein
MDIDWVPQACTLPTPQQPLRLAEFDTLFHSALRSVERPVPSRVRLQLAAAARPEAVRLTEAESRCCAFFDFTVGPAEDDYFDLDVRVPAGHLAVLDGLTARAEAVLRP